MDGTDEEFDDILSTLSKCACMRIFYNTHEAEPWLVRSNARANEEERLSEDQLRGQIK